MGFATSKQGVSKKEEKEMGHRRDSEIANFRNRTGLQQPTGVRLAVIQELKRKTVELFEILVLEESGIRDGDGYWSFCDPVEGQVRSLQETLHRPEASGEPIRNRDIK